MPCTFGVAPAVPGVFAAMSMIVYRLEKVSGYSFIG
jgi:hypothetical protein